MLRFHRGYFAAALLLFAVEVAIALWVRDAIIRPYGGDVLAVVLVYCALRSVLAIRPAHAALLAFAVGALIELAQLAGLADALEVPRGHWLRIVFGSQFEVADLLAYGAGAALALLADLAAARGARISRGAPATPPSSSP